MTRSRISHKRSYNSHFAKSPIEILCQTDLYRIFYKLVRIAFFYQSYLYFICWRCLYRISHKSAYAAILLNLPVIGFPINLLIQLFC